MYLSIIMKHSFNLRSPFNQTPQINDRYRISSPVEEIAHWKMAKRSFNNHWLNRKRMLNLENDSLERPSLPKRRYAGPEDEELDNQSDEYAFD
uniref:Uncharacterized protein n=1 Tax=Heterorhabditis bacteriophora TaxID=37862 RepID=A0A1I7WUE2_HETBA